MHSARITLGLACFTANDLINEKKSISQGLAKTLRGIKPIINCSWQHKICAVTGFSFFLERTGAIIFSEETRGEEITKTGLISLQKIVPGDIIKFDNIRIKCDDDDANSIYDIKT